ncbi:membrane-bound lytic murein transglycosylase A [Polaromonas sp. CG_9.7]|nr:membrane-bound lytic murein transglycosylase A [Polaromonas sp. CG_9.7]MDH6183314.1 membrane-bound lytic murein transglycosylase A [Polaromonas sp. CG_23.6]
MIDSWKAAASMKRPRGLRPSWRKVSIIAAALFLAACTSVPLPPASMPDSVSVPTAVRPDDAGPLPPPRLLSKSRWVPVHWAELPGFEEDTLFEAWNAWIKSCERPGPVFAPLCSEVRRLSIASAQEQRDWMVARLQPYRVESLQGSADGLLTSYYEPVLKASRLPGAGYGVPVYRTPATLGSRKPWFSRQEIDTLPEARAALRGREIAWVDDPVEVMSLHIQGSGRLNITEPDGSQRVVRVAYAGSNEQPFRSVTQWLFNQGEGKMLAPWVESTKVWAFKNPQRVQQMLWSNPRYTFFQEQPLSDFDAAFGPKGAQGVPLTPGRSIAVDPGSIPYGTPVWLASRGGAANLQKLVLAQDTGSAIVGAVRADYFAGTGVDAGLLASRVNQPLRLWALWPK